MERLWAPWRLEYIQGPQPDHCIFCFDEDRGGDHARLVVARGVTCCVIVNRYPYSNGHLMIAPYRHLADFDALDKSEVLEIHRLTVLGQKVLRKVYAAQGFNVGWNLGQVAGAGIAGHIHLHVVPRWAGDNNFMSSLADVRVIPQHIEETRALLAEAFAMADFS